MQNSYLNLVHAQMSFFSLMNVSSHYWSIISLQTKATKPRVALKKFGGLPVLKFLQRLAFRFSIYIFVCNFSRDVLTDNLKKWF